MQESKAASNSKIRLDMLLELGRGFPIKVSTF